MTLREYCFHYELTLVQLSRDTGIGIQSLSTLSRRIHSPSLEVAIKLIEYSGNKITLHDLIRKDKKKK